MASGRPEHTAPPEIFYNKTEAEKYRTSTRMIEIQTQMTNRALELLNLDDDSKPHYILDIGCGTGLSGKMISKNGNFWVGVDISESMLNIANQDSDEKAQLVLMDMGQGIPFRPGTFDGCISISALQWLCNVDKKSHNPIRRLRVFFQTLYNCLTKNGRCVFQFYPENEHQIELISSSAMRCGFNGGLVVDFPNSTKAKKYFLVIYTGRPPKQQPKALSDPQSKSASSQYESKRSGSSNNNNNNNSSSSINNRRRRSKRKAIKDKNWVQEKKERRRRQGKKTQRDSKYTARSRRRF